ncbi:MAG: cytochrome c [Bacteroidia bacterium]|nr:cytochrome c [Bacteroidia bacterium]
MKLFLRIVKWTAVVLVVLVAGLYAFVELTWDRRYEAPYPQISASTDSAVIARGKYLAFGPAHCATCHVPMDKIRAVEDGLEMPLSGGWELTLSGFGTFRAPNLTPDEETGIGKQSDEELARALRHMVASDGRFLPPFMPFQEMSDEDLTAVISFLRSQPPVRNAVKRSELGFIARALVAFGMLGPEGPKRTPARSVPRDASKEYGRYLAYNIGNCLTCHTQMDPNTAELIGEHFAGKGVFEPDAFSEGYSFVSPNLTPDPSTGIIAGWTEEAFVARFRNGRVHRGSPMPWGAFSRMDEVDLRALYRFFKSLDPVRNKVEKTVFEPGQELPKF